MSVKSRGMVIAGHPTSLRLESTFWRLLRVVAVECGYSVTGLIECIAIMKHAKQNLSSAIRVYCRLFLRRGTASSASGPDQQVRHTTWADAGFESQSLSRPTLGESVG